MNGIDDRGSLLAWVRAGGQDRGGGLVVSREVEDFLAKFLKNRALEAWKSVIAIEREKKNVFIPGGEMAGAHCVVKFREARWKSAGG